MIVPPGQTRWCLVCQKSVQAGEEFVPHTSNKHVGRHATCQPKSKWNDQSKAGETPAKRVMDGSPKKRRSGGHGYSGGTGFSNL